MQSVARRGAKSTAKASKPVASVREPGKPLQKRRRDTRQAGCRQAPQVRDDCGQGRPRCTVRCLLPDAVAHRRSWSLSTIEHRYIASLLRSAGGQADNLLPGRSPDYGMIHDIVRLHGELPDQYHHPREDLVFDRLLERDAESRDVVEQLLEGHREVSRLSRELLDELSRGTSGDHPADKQKIKFLCDRYIGYYWDHMNMEEGKLFPAQPPSCAGTTGLRSTPSALCGRPAVRDTGAQGISTPLRVSRNARSVSPRSVAIAELFGIEALIETAVLSSAVGEIQDVVDARLRQSFSALRRRRVPKNVVICWGVRAPSEPRSSSRHGRGLRISAK
ncbi:MAG: hemerythrin domain-containing protein [Gammaproteobacteria bacterium]|nr:hemerythrin domain-containing protein [Gammaproteobacteria bacterium]